MSEDKEKREIKTLADINPEIKKLPPDMQAEFNRRYEGNPEAWYLALRAEDCEKIIEQEKEELFFKLRNKNLSRIDYAETRKQFIPWEILYKEEFGIDIDFKDLTIPEKKPGFDVLLVVAAGMTPDRIADKLAEKVKVEKYVFNLDTIISARKTNKLYAVWAENLRKINFPDVEIGSPAKVLTNEGTISYITLEERLLFELIYFREMGWNTYLFGTTICRNSVDLGGCYPGVFWDEREQTLNIDWYGNTDFRYFRK